MWTGFRRLTYVRIEKKIRNGRAGEEGEALHLRCIRLSVQVRNNTDITFVLPE